MTPVKRIVFWSAVSYLTIIFLVYLSQHYLLHLFWLRNERISPSDLRLTGVGERAIRRPDGVEILTWFLSATPKKPTILYFHGNAGSLAMTANRIRLFGDEGWGIFVMSYRGYSGSAGNPSESANVEDAEAAYLMLSAEVGCNNIILYGESLGTAIAVRVGAKWPVRAVILEAAFTSILDVAVDTYFFLPMRWVVTPLYDSGRHIGEITAPILFLHGERDWVVPIKHGRALFQKANPPKLFAAFAEADHNDLLSHGAIGSIRGFVGDVLATEYKTECRLK